MNSKIKMKKRTIKVKSKKQMQSVNGGLNVRLVRSGERQNFKLKMKKQHLHMMLKSYR